MTVAVTRPQQPGEPLGRARAQREQLTRLLRGLAARLDELDRELADLAWRRGRPSAALGEMLCERTALEAERSQLTARLGGLADRLKVIDGALSHDGDLPGAARVGMCPYCGYPTLGSGLCAFCRPHLAR
ncbi:MAG: hypothetical protein ACKOQ4_15970 [Mycobacterium sp.]